MTVVACKLLTYKGQYNTCQIKVPDVEVKLSAIEIDSQYYSLFRRFKDADTVVQALEKLSKHQGEVLALTRQKSNYTMWALELEALAFKGPRKQSHHAWPTHGPAKCLMLGDATQYQQCYVQVPELAEPIIAVHHDNRFYSVYQPGLGAIAALKLAAKFTRRGNESAIAATAKGYAVCLWEPEATKNG
ncbi:hypothetical protein [Leptothoe kymatousa]|uniref:Uncharacterized protein n=1 Tax=Leptothoe kymatousa TAU-MAC 1615 TaxID=2364775 RepID=A0ABS5XZI0_9CYAN|nr:hypothetical protein [Leptothoe kymatousa]MBT9310980.1 hypothetical protein [Leptothoe kymatousa TAU-MAC 1615]